MDARRVEEDDDDRESTAGYRPDRSKQKTEEDSKDKGQKQKAQKKKKLEPSLKWKALGMEEYQEPWVFNSLAVYVCCWVCCNHHHYLHYHLIFIICNIKFL